MTKKNIIPIVFLLILLVSINTSCKKPEDENKAPEIPTSPTPVNNATDIDIAEATIQWACTDPENDALTYDVYFGTAENPTLAKADHSGTSYDAGTFEPATKYYWKIVAKDGNNHETPSPVWNFTTAETVEETCTDYDGNTYQTVVIGNQTWMAEDLKSTHYADGTAIPNVVAYNNDENNVATFGRLYTWEDAMNGEAETNTNPSNVQGVCPNGYHLPSNAEWQELITYLGGSDLAGGKLKSTSASHWASPNTGATNESGFNGVGSGYYSDGNFNYLSYGSVYWTTTLENTSNAYFIALDYNFSQTFNNTWGVSINKNTIRCIKN